MLKAMTRMIFAVMAVVCLLIGIFWIWFVQAYVVNWVEGETLALSTAEVSVFYALTILWFFLSVLFWWIFRRLTKQDQQEDKMP